MEIAIIVAIVLLNLIVHELGHAITMIRNGVKVKEIGLGWKLSFIPHLIFKSADKKRPSFVISPILVGAYVEPYDKKDIENLPYIKKAEIFSAGVLANIILGTIILIFLLLPQVSSIKEGVILFFLTAVIPIIILFRKQIGAVMPILGLAMLGLVIWSLFNLGLKDSLAGPIGIFQMAGGASKTIKDAMVFGTIFSFAIAGTNMFPLVPLDGGLITEALLYRLFGRKKWVGLVSRIGIVLFISLLFLALSADIARIFS